MAALNPLDEYDSISEMSKRISNITLSKKEAQHTQGRLLQSLIFMKDTFEIPALKSSTLIPEFTEMVRQMKKAIETEDIEPDQPPYIRQLTLSERWRSPLIRELERKAQLEQRQLIRIRKSKYSAAARADPTHVCNTKYDTIVVVEIIPGVNWKMYRLYERKMARGKILFNRKFGPGFRIFHVNSYFPWRWNPEMRKKKPIDYSQHEHPIFQFFRDNDCPFKIFPITEFQATIPEALYNIDDFWDAFHKIPLDVIDIELFVAESLRIYKNLMTAHIEGKIYGQYEEWKAYIEKFQPTKKSFARREYIKTGSMMRTNAPDPPPKGSVVTGPNMDPNVLQRHMRENPNQYRTQKPKPRKPIDQPEYRMVFPSFPKIGSPRVPFPPKVDMGDQFRNFLEKGPAYFAAGLFIYRNQAGVNPICANDARPWVWGVWQQFAKGPITATHLLPSGKVDLHNTNEAINAPFIMAMDFLGDPKLQQKALVEFRKKWAAAIHDPEVSNQPFSTWVQQAPLAVGLGFVLPDENYEVQWLRPKQGLPEGILFDFENDKREWEFVADGLNEKSVKEVWELLTTPRIFPIDKNFPKGEEKMTPESGVLLIRNPLGQYDMQKYSAHLRDYQTEYKKLDCRVTQDYAQWESLYITRFPHCSPQQLSKGVTKIVRTLTSQADLEHIPVIGTLMYSSLENLFIEKNVYTYFVDEGLPNPYTSGQKVLNCKVYDSTTMRLINEIEWSQIITKDFMAYVRDPKYVVHLYDPDQYRVVLYIWINTGDLPKNYVGESKYGLDGRVYTHNIAYLFGQNKLLYNAIRSGNERDFFVLELDSVEISPDESIELEKLELEENQEKLDKWIRDEKEEDIRDEDDVGDLEDIEDEVVDLEKTSISPSKKVPAEVYIKLCVQNKLEWEKFYTFIFSSNPPDGYTVSPRMPKKFDDTRLFEPMRIAFGSRIVKMISEGGNDAIKAKILISLIKSSKINKFNDWDEIIGIWKSFQVKKSWDLTKDLLIKNFSDHRFYDKNGPYLDASNAARNDKYLLEKIFTRSNLEYFKSKFHTSYKRMGSDLKNLVEPINKREIFPNLFKSGDKFSIIVGNFWNYSVWARYLTNDLLKKGFEVNDIFRINLQDLFKKIKNFISKNDLIRDDFQDINFDKIQRIDIDSKFQELIYEQDPNIPNDELDDAKSYLYRGLIKNFIEDIDSYIQSFNQFDTASEWLKAEIIYFLSRLKKPFNDDIECYFSNNLSLYLEKNKNANIYDLPQYEYYIERRLLKICYITNQNNASATLDKISSRLNISKSNIKTVLNRNGLAIGSIKIIDITKSFSEDFIFHPEKIVDFSYNEISAKFAEFKHPMSEYEWKHYKEGTGNYSDVIAHMEKMGYGNFTLDELRKEFQNRAIEITTKTLENYYYKWRQIKEKELGIYVPHAGSGWKEGKIFSFRGNVFAYMKEKGYGNFTLDDVLNKFKNDEEYDESKLKRMYNAWIIKVEKNLGIYNKTQYNKGTGIKGDLFAYMEEKGFDNFTFDQLIQDFNGVNSSSLMNYYYEWRRKKAEELGVELENKTGQILKNNGKRRELFAWMDEKGLDRFTLAELKEAFPPSVVKESTVESDYYRWKRENASKLGIVLEDRRSKKQSPQSDVIAYMNKKGFGNFTLDDLIHEFESRGVPITTIKPAFYKWRGEKAEEEIIYYMDEKGLGNFNLDDLIEKFMKFGIKESLIESIYTNWKLKKNE